MSSTPFRIDFRLLSLAEIDRISAKRRLYVADLAQQDVEDITAIRLGIPAPLTFEERAALKSGK